MRVRNIRFDRAIQEANAEFNKQKTADDAADLAQGSPTRHHHHALPSACTVRRVGAAVRVHAQVGARVCVQMQVCAWR